MVLRSAVFDGRQGNGKLIWIDVIGSRFDVDENRRCAEQLNDLGRGDESEGRGEDSISGPDPVCHQGEQEGIGPGGARNGMANAAILRQLLFQ